MRKWLYCIAAIASVSCSDSADRLEGLEEWSVANVARVTIGAIDGDTSYLFQDVSDVEVAQDGRILVADGGLGVIRIYAGDGTFLEQVGRPGEGPGEFRALREIWLTPSNSLAAWDSELRRFTYFESNGEVRTVQVALGPETTELGNLEVSVGQLANGSVLLGALSFGSADWTGTDRVTVVRFGPDGEYKGVVGEGTGILRAQYRGNRKAPVAFTPYPYFATHRQVVFHTSGSDSTVQVWAPDLRRVITFPGAKQPSAAEWSDLGVALRARGQGYFHELHQSSDMPSQSPHLAGLIVDDRGRIWTKRYDPLTDSFWLGGGGQAGGGVWWVADQDGELLATAPMPERFRPMHAIGDALVGVAVDEIGVHRVEVRGFVY